MEALQIAGSVIAFFILFGMLVWLANDVWETHGPTGCAVAGIIILFTAPLFPFLFIAYLYLKHHYYGRPRPTEKAEKVDQWTWRSRRMQSEREKNMLPYITAEESDEHIDLLLAEGKREAALQVAQELLDTALGFADEKGILRYSKYVEYIRRGGGGK